jgi:isopentenyl-diphosphate Delta-isomerase
MNLPERIKEMAEQDGIKRRKEDHVQIVLHRDVTGRNITTGLERYQFIHNALPEIDFGEISLETCFAPIGKRLKAPLLVSSMTGGTKNGGLINRNLAMAAQDRGWAMGLGSLRIALEYPETRETFQVRRYAPDIPIIANLGAVQLNEEIGVEECKRVVELVEADALVFHLNSLQEVFQPEGNTRFHGLLGKLEKVCRELPIPVGVKEVGMGIDGELAARLMESGVRFVDVAGAGGTSWILVEKHRLADSLRKDVADAFADWGIPTAECIVDVRKHVSNGYLIASGGLHTGVDAAKAIALGADLAGFARPLLEPSISSSPQDIIRKLERIELELKIAMFGIGVKTLDKLKGTKRLMRKG